MICFPAARDCKLQGEQQDPSMPAAQPNLWGASDAYERYMGRWSRIVAPIFTTWIGVRSGAHWLDVGCGTGVLTSAILSGSEPGRIVGIDSSAIFLEAAQRQVRDPRVSFRKGDAQSLPEGNEVFDVAVSGLVLNFVPDKDAMLSEMARVVRPGGTVALYVWDYPGHMQVMRYFFDAANALDPRAQEFDDGVKASFCRPAPLAELLTSAGLADVEQPGRNWPTSPAR